MVGIKNKWYPMMGWMRGWPCDNDGIPLEGDGSEISHFVSDYLYISWFSFAFIFVGKNKRPYDRK